MAAVLHEIGLYKRHVFSTVQERIDSVVSFGKMLNLNIFVCINNGLLEMVEEGQNHPDNPCQSCNLPRVFVPRRR